MSLIKRTTFYNSIVQYLGIVLGYVNVIVLFPLVCTTEEFGITRLIMSMAVLFSQVSNFGISKTIIKMFPLFRTEDSRHHGLVTWAMLAVMVGFVVLCIPYVLFKPLILEYFAAELSSFGDYYYLVLPTALFMLLYNTFESMLQALRLTVFTNFIKDVFIRIVIAVELLMMYLGVLDFESFLIAFVLSYLFNAIISVAYLMVIGELKINFDRFAFHPHLSRYIGSYTSFAALSIVSAILVSHIDKVMIGFLVGVHETAVYSMAAYIVAVVNVPSRALGRITLPILSAKYKKKDFQGLQDIYQKSALNQMLAGSFVFGGIALSINQVFELLPQDYNSGHWIIFWIGMSTLVNTGLGANGQIITLSKHFRFDATTSIILMVLTISTNLTIIPIYGMNGAAFATFISITVYNLIKFEFLRRKLNLNPFSFNTIKALIAVGLPFAITYLIPAFDHPMVTILVRSVIFSLLVLTTVLISKPSKDIDDILRSVIATVRSKLGT